MKDILNQTIYRARFSSITESAILQAFRSLTAPNWNEARSVDARMELDLRIGCSFTRFQTKTFQVLIIVQKDYLWLRMLYSDSSRSILAWIIVLFHMVPVRHLHLAFVSNGTMRYNNLNQKNFGNWMSRYSIERLQKGARCGILAHPLLWAQFPVKV